MKRKAADQDSPWKEVLERYFEPFLAFFFPETLATRHDPAERLHGKLALVRMLCE